MRSVVKDSTDLDTPVFLDSDGHYNDNSARTKINGNPANDGAWHMVRIPFLARPHMQRCVNLCCQREQERLRDAKES